MILQHILKTGTLNSVRCLCLAREKVYLISYTALRFNHDDIIPKPVGPKTLARFRRKDKVPNNFELIYHAPSEFYFRMAYMHILLLSVAVPSYSLIIANKHNFALPIVWGNIVIDDFWPFAFFQTFVFTVGIVSYLLVTRFPIRIYHNRYSDEYISSFLSSIPWKTYNKSFMKGDVQRIENPDRWYTYMYASNYTVKGKKTILLEDYFRRPVDLENMIKYND